MFLDFFSGAKFNFTILPSKVNLEVTVSVAITFAAEADLT